MGSQGLEAHHHTAILPPLDTVLVLAVHTHQPGPAPPTDLQTSQITIVSLRNFWRGRRSSRTAWRDCTQSTRQQVQQDTVVEVAVTTERLIVLATTTLVCFVLYITAKLKYIITSRL